MWHRQSQRDDSKSYIKSRQGVKNGYMFIYNNVILILVKMQNLNLPYDKMALWRNITDVTNCEN